jgi:hypothetical protein
VRGLDLGRKVPTNFGSRGESGRSLFMGRARAADGGNEAGPSRSKRAATGRSKKGERCAARCCC